MFYIKKSNVEAVAVDFIFALLYAASAVHGELIASPRTHYLSLVATDVPQVVPILGHYLDGLRVELIIRLRY